MKAFIAAISLCFLFAEPQPATTPCQVTQQYVVSQHEKSDVTLTYKDYGESKLYKTDIRIHIQTGETETIITPAISGGYSPSLFFGNFLDNGLKQILLRIDSSGSGAYSYVLKLHSLIYKTTIEPLS